MEKENIVVFGATSAIAEEFCKQKAPNANFLLVGRSKEKLQIMKNNLEISYKCECNIMTIDFIDYAKHSDIIKNVFSQYKKIDLILMAQGFLGDQEEAQKDFNLTKKIIEVNFLSSVSLLTYISNEMEKRKYGQIAVITSVAGDRGRAPNYIYGASKGGLSIFLSGLRVRLFSSGINVVDIKPGFVDTPMTANFKKGILFSSPITIAKGIAKAVNKRKSKVYLPWFWLLIMFIINNIPEFIFKRIKI